LRAAAIAILLFVAIGIFAGNRFTSVRNDLIAKREAMSAEWSQLDAAFENRAELIIRVVETVKDFETNQAALFQEAAAARAALTGGRSPEEKIQASERLSRVLGRLLVASENYPKLRSNKSFLRLQEELGKAESQIAVERRSYNEILEHYNAQIQRFPDNLVAGVSGFRRNDAYFKTAPGAL
jgi:LemA protein